MCVYIGSFVVGDNCGRAQCRLIGLINRFSVRVFCCIYLKNHVDICTNLFTN